ncbi:MAG: peptide/nickel transport system substrate-binding protein [bacterium]|nr:peptide/nickel transport system substrate-binding protein [bacterium]
MDNKNLLRCLAIGLLMLFLLSPFVSAEVKNPDTIVIATIGDVDTLDPHFSYDTASGEIIYNVYENLIGYKGESVTDFVPLLATEVPSAENGLIRDDGKTYIFPIRKGVKFHNGYELTPEDVAYSFKRCMILDRTGGPSWMILDPLLGYESLEDLVRDKANVSDWDELFTEDGKLKPEYESVMQEIYEMIDKAVEVQGDKVIFHLAKPYPPFLNVLAQGAGWSAILSKKWCIEQGDWPGTPDEWWKYHDPQKEKDPLYEKMNGTGPFKLVEWRKGEYVKLERNENYWREPAKIKYVLIKKVDEWATRRMLLERGDADAVYVPRHYLPQIEKMEGVRIIRGLPTLAIETVLFNFNIRLEGNPYIGSGKLDGNGIPSDFFSDIHVRKGFCYLFDWDTYIKEVWRGEAVQPTGIIPKGLLGYNPDGPKYSFDMKRAEEEFRKAWNGKVWEKGFKFTILYNSGNEERKIAAEMLARNARKLNPKFKIEVRGVQWSTYLSDLTKGNLPLFIMGWLADHPDPHNFVQPFLSSRGTFMAYQGRKAVELAKAEFDELIEKAMMTNDPKEREKIYFELQRKEYEFAPHILLYQAMGVHVSRSWIKGWYYNPMRPGGDFYSLYKSEE